MKIRNESESESVTEFELELELGLESAFQSILNRNDSQTQAKQSVHDGLLTWSHPHAAYDKISNVTNRRWDSHSHSKHCPLLPPLSNVWNLRQRCCCYCCYHDHHHDHHHIRDKIKKQQTSRRRFFLHRLTQLCHVVLLLLPFLVTYDTLIQQVSGQDVTHLVVSTSKQPKPATAAAATPIKTCLHFNEVIKSRHSHARGLNNLIFSNNHRRINGYSLIILSQTANKLNNTNDRENKEESKDESRRSLKQDAPKVTVSDIDYRNGSSANRTKRSTKIETKNLIKTQTETQMKSNHKAERQIELEVDFGKNKGNSMYNKINNNNNNKIINKEKLTKLVMNGLGLKKLPDMRKANISQIEYSSKYLEYLERLRRNQGARRHSQDWAYGVDRWDPTPTTLEIQSIVTNHFSDITKKRWRQRRATRGRRPTGKWHEAGGVSEKTNILLHFPLALDKGDFHYEKIDEANVRLMMLYNPALATQVTNQRTSQSSKGNSRHKATHMKPKKNCDLVQHLQGPGLSHLHNRKLPKPRTHILNLRVFQLLPSQKRRQLDIRKIEFESSNYDIHSDETRSQWLEFDVTDAVRSWLNRSHDNLGIEVQCDKCRRIGARILSDIAMPTKSTQEQAEEEAEADRFHLAPVLNIIGHVGRTHREKGVQPPSLSSGNHSNHYFNHRANYGSGRQHGKKWPNSCYKAHQRCCRHQLDVAFKDIKGFEFIIQPKIFDAGYCKGRCPPRHNPAHHHALLQSLIWQQDHNRAPRPCCAPSKLTELEILHVDEEFTDKLKISTWSDMQILECACS